MPTMSNIRISQCMIVKNEEKNIERALSWGKGIMTEQIVVDTGSTDRTAEMAEELGAKVYHFPWREDFAAAKNFAIDKARGDWIVFLDADEYFTEEDAAKIPNLLSTIERLQAKSKNQLKLNLVTTKLVNLDPKGNVKDMAFQSRIFRRDFDIRYVGKIHEQLQSLDPGKQLAEVDTDIIIYHTGYAWIEENAQIQSERSLFMLEKEPEESPDSAETLLDLAESYAVAGELGKSIEYAKRALSNADGCDPLSEPRRNVAHQLLLYNMYTAEKKAPDSYSNDDFLACYRQAVEDFPDQADYYIARALWEFLQERYDLTLDFSDRALTKLKGVGDFTTSKAMQFLPMLHAVQSYIYAKRNDFQNAFRDAALALDYDPYQKSVLTMMLERLTNHDPATTEDIVSFLRKIYDFRKQKDLTFIQKVALDVGNRELADALAVYGN